MSSHLPTALCDHNALIRRQFIKIESLEKELSTIRLERDSLLDSNERLLFQIQLMNVRSNDVTRSEWTDSGATTTSADTQTSTAQSRTPVGKDDQKYELSQQLIDRRVDQLERKYGGQVARESAVRIQRAWRTYRLQKRFKTIAFQALRQQTTQDDSYDVTVRSLDSQSTDDSHDNQSHAFIAESLMTSSNGSQQLVECQRKRQYRVGLNLLNKHPSERGIHFLISNGFIERTEIPETQAEVIAHFLLTRKGVSKAMIGEYVSTNSAFNKHVLTAFAREIDLSGLAVDTALRKFQTFFRFPGEAQKIERLVDAFATRYVFCNVEECLSRDSVFILAFAIIMLNTDLHTPTNQRNRMTANQWLQNLNGVFAEGNLPEQFLLDIYHRIKAQELRTGADHVTQVAKVQSAMVAPRAAAVPNLCVQWRRLVCYCRLYEIRDKNKKESRDRHQREVFLFNDLLLITKLSARARASHQMPEYVFRQSLPLDVICVHTFETPFHKFGIALKPFDGQKAIVTFNARNDLDQKRFCDDLRESIAETQSMETIRIQKSSSLLQLSSAAVEDTPGPSTEAPQNRRKSSSGSLDSGLSLPSRDHSPQTSSNGKVI